MAQIITTDLVGLRFQHASGIHFLKLQWTSARRTGILLRVIGFTVFFEFSHWYDILCDELDGDHLLGSTHEAQRLDELYVIKWRLLNILFFPLIMVIVQLVELARARIGLLTLQKFILNFMICKSKSVKVTAQGWSTMRVKIGVLVSQDKV